LGENFNAGGLGGFSGSGVAASVVAFALVAFLIAILDRPLVALGLGVVVIAGDRLLKRWRKRR
jgi:hypothetical protein